jgi:hypothetical protein
MRTSFPSSKASFSCRLNAGIQWVVGFLCSAAVLLTAACSPTGARAGGKAKEQGLSDRIQAETMKVTVNAVAPEGHRFQAHNQYTSLATFKGNIYAVSYDSARRPYLHKVDEDTERCERGPLDRNEKDVYRAYADGHHLFSIGIDRDGYIHVLGDMHHGGDPWYRRKSDNPLPKRFHGSHGGQMYWVSDRPEDISRFSFMGKDAQRHIPCHHLSYAYFRTDVNGTLYMAARQSVRRPRRHVPGTMGMGLWRYDAERKRWTALGGVPKDKYGFEDCEAVFPSVVWEPHGHGPENPWYQSFFSNVKFDRSNRLHLVTPINADRSVGDITHLVYAYSDDGGETFRRADGTPIAPLPVRVTGPEQNRGSIPIEQGEPEAFNGHFTGLFWNRAFEPAVVYQSREKRHSRYRYFLRASNEWKTADYPVQVPWIRGDHFTGPHGAITFIGSKAICRAPGFGEKGRVFPLAGTPLTPDGGGCLCSVDASLLRDENTLRGIGRQGEKTVIATLTFQ